MTEDVKLKKAEKQENNNKSCNPRNQELMKIYIARSVQI